MKIVHFWMRQGAKSGESALGGRDWFWNAVSSKKGHFQPEVLNLNML